MINDVETSNLRTATGSASRAYNDGDTKQEPAIIRAYGELTKNLADLHECVEILTVKLEPVLGPSVPTAADNVGAKDPSSSSPLASSIRSDASRVRDLYFRIDTLIRRVEI